MNESCHENLVLGVDGGGSKTVAWLAARDGTVGSGVLGRGQAGVSNAVAAGIEHATGELDRAIQGAFDDAGQPRQSVASVCLALSGVDRPTIRDPLKQWAEIGRLASQVTLVHDAVPVLAAACPTRTGIALICGTGSLAWGRNAKGRSARCGGWGAILGDEGSGYRIGEAGLRSAARAADGRGTVTPLLSMLLDHFQIDSAASLVDAVHSGAAESKSRVAACAPVVIAAAERADPIAVTILADAADALAEMVSTLAHRLALPEQQWTLALAGGLLVAAPQFREQVIAALVASHRPRDCHVVEHPVVGAVQIARCGCHAKGTAAKIDRIHRRELPARVSPQLQMPFANPRLAGQSHLRRLNHFLKQVELPPANRRDGSERRIETIDHHRRQARQWLARHGVRDPSDAK